jgi:ribonuclease-3
VANPDRTELENALAHRFTRSELLEQALTHSSLADPGGGGTNERLEFLGDRVLGLVVAEMLVERFPDEDVGPLARRHVALVRRETLAGVARSTPIAESLKLSAGEESAGGRTNDALLADGCEAVIAALYLDGGLPAAAGFIRRHWADRMERAAGKAPVDAKTALQEWAQARGLAVPVYAELAREGSAHAPQFRVSVSVSGLGIAEGTGSSKRTAEQQAAQALMIQAADQ